MGATETKAFKNGNSTAVRLPASLGIVPGARLRVERSGDGVIIRPVHDPEKVQRELAEMFADIEAIWAEAGGPPPHPAERDPFEAPERPGL